MLWILTDGSQFIILVVLDFCCENLIVEGWFVSFGLVKVIPEYFFGKIPLCTKSFWSSLWLWKPWDGVFSLKMKQFKNLLTNTHILTWVVQDIQDKVVSCVSSSQSECLGETELRTCVVFPHSGLLSSFDLWLRKFSCGFGLIELKQTKTHFCELLQFLLNFYCVLQSVIS